MESARTDFREITNTRVEYSLLFFWKVSKDNLVLLKNVFDRTLNFKDSSKTL